MTSRQNKYALLTRFKKGLKEKGLPDTINIYVEQWAADDLINSYTLPVCYDLVDYYFQVSESPTWKWFAYNAEKIYKAKKIRDEDMETRKILRQQAKDWLNK